MQLHLNLFWLEVARKLHNKGVKELASLWDEQVKEWKLDPAKELGISRREEALLGQVR